jgi:two-component system, chemotaxis family, protein-glutamate methylesterase/glutaminase
MGHRHEIVVIGASLGGLKALLVLLARFPGDFPLPIAIVQHRRKDPDDGLVAMLAGSSTLACCEAEDKQSLNPGVAYLAPANYHLLVEKERCALSTDAPVLCARPSIDVLFESAAEAFGPGAIGVVLTGSNADGARGAARIKQRGGLIVVQDPATAESPAMPRAAIATVSVDRVLPLQGIVGFLSETCGLHSRSGKFNQEKSWPAITR